MAGIKVPGGHVVVSPWRALVALWFLGPNAWAILRLPRDELRLLLLFGVAVAFTAEFVVPPLGAGVSLVWAGLFAVMFCFILRKVLVAETAQPAGQELSAVMAIGINAPLLAEFVRVLGGAEPLVLVIFVLNVSYACGLVLRPSVVTSQDLATECTGHNRARRAVEAPRLLFGPMIGRFGGRPIYAWIEDEGGRRFSFDGMAPLPQQPGARRFYDELCTDASSWVAVEGGIYRAHSGALPTAARSGQAD